MTSQRAAGSMEQRAPQVGDLDPRLLETSRRGVLVEVALDHDVSFDGVRCWRCGWVVGGGQRVCPSRALARCITNRRPVPAWLVHFVGVVPGVTAPRVRGAGERRASEDALPGLFDAPARVEPAGVRR